MKVIPFGPNISFTKLDNGTVVLRIHEREAHISPGKWAEIVADLEKP